MRKEASTSSALPFISNFSHFITFSVSSATLPSTSNDLFVYFGILFARRDDKFDENK
jgi:hypothetical protein